MLEEEIPVTVSKKIETYRQTITPRSPDEVLAIVSALAGVARQKNVTGTITINVAQGGVRTIDVENCDETLIR